MDKQYKKTQSTFWAAVVGYATGIVNLAAEGECIPVSSEMLGIFKELASIDFREADIISASLSFYHRGEEESL